MKIAFCISGLFKPSTTHSEAYSNKFAYLKLKIKEYNADTFIFSFSKNLETEIIDIFEPKRVDFQYQDDFSLQIQNISNHLNKETAKKVFSFFYSRKRVCQLRQEYEDKIKIKYDAVVLCRPDLGYISTENFQLPNLHCLDLEYLYSMYWNQLNAGMADWYFISNSSNIDFISKVYDKLPEYLSFNSAYQQSIINGFPYSDNENRFSQEIFKATPKHSEKIDPINMLNQHLLIKFYLLDHYKFSLKFLKFANQPNEY